MKSIEEYVVRSKEIIDYLEQHAVDIQKNNDRPIYGDYETHKITYFLPVVGMLFPNQVVYYGETFACLRKRLLKLEPDYRGISSGIAKVDKENVAIGPSRRKVRF